MRAATERTPLHREIAKAKNTARDERWPLRSLILSHGTYACYRRIALIDKCGAVFGLCERVREGPPHPPEGGRPSPPKRGASFPRPCSVCTAAFPLTRSIRATCFKTPRVRRQATAPLLPHLVCTRSARTFTRPPLGQQDRFSPRDGCPALHVPQCLRNCTSSLLVLWIQHPKPILRPSNMGIYRQSRLA